MSLSLDDIRDIAFERLYESRHHDEQWDFLFRTVGSREIVYLPHDTIEEWDFDPERWGWFEIEETRKRDILSGGLPTSSEVRKWKLSRASGMLGTLSTECRHAFIVPILNGVNAQGYALFDCGIMDGHPNAEPWLLDVFWTEGEANAAIEALGVI